MTPAPQTEDLIAQLEALIDKVTPSPWDVIDRDDEPLQLVHYDGDADDNGREVIHRYEICSIADDENEDAHLAYLRLCQPANIRTLLDALAAAERRVVQRDKLAEASRKFWVRAAEAALAGDTRELRNRVELAKAGPLVIVLSEESNDGQG